MADTSQGTIASTTEDTFVVVDLGKRRRSEVKDLRKGHGNLFGEVEETLVQLKADGLKGTVIFVVEEKRTLLDL
jgi:hypothetical protein